jgi:hypothetical protein
MIFELRSTTEQMPALVFLFQRRQGEFRLGLVLFFAIPFVAKISQPVK